ncbi:Ras-related protein Rac2 [Gryllus bimaculatus]|nr:Ras-related protein Rac2 [Gryllus bimaculatus]
MEKEALNSQNGVQDKYIVMAVEPRISQQKQYDYLLKFLLVGDSDVGKQEILSGLEDGSSESPFCSGSAYKTTTILLDGKRVKLQLWDTSGQGRFCTIIRSYSRGAQGILLVYDITNKWSFDGIDRWLKEVEEHAPGVPKVLVGNRLHLAFKRQVGAREAEAYAAKNRMAFFEVMLSLQELCCRAIVARTNVYSIDQLPLPPSVKSHLKSYAMTSYSASALQQRHFLPSGSRAGPHKRLRFVALPGTGATPSPGSTPAVDAAHTSCTGRNSYVWNVIT